MTHSKAVAWMVVLMFAACRMAAAQQSVVLSSDQAKPMLKQCSRSTPKDVDGAWDVPQSVINALEQDLPKLSAVVAEQCCFTGIKIHDPLSYFRQYVGVTIRGKKYVYINAYRDTHKRTAGQVLEKVGREPEIICDGGDISWGALYDPESRTFSQLAVNGAI